MRPKFQPAKLKLQVKRSSAGLGLFAGEDIPKGTCIIEYTGKMLPNSKADFLTTKYLFTINSRFTLDGSSRKNRARYINHGCRPNAESDVHKGRVFISAIKNIKAGDEITYNYGKEYYDSFIKPHGCRCAMHMAKAKAEKAKRANGGASRR
jgi:SET domain-containing protein